MNSCGIFAKNIWQFTKGKAPRNTSWDIKRELSKEEGGITASWNGWHHFFKAFHEMRCSCSEMVNQGAGITVTAHGEGRGVCKGIHTCVCVFLACHKLVPVIKSKQ